MIDPNDMAMLVYFWEEKGDIERYAGFEDIKPDLQAEYPEVLKVWNDYITARLVVTSVLRDASQRSSNKPSEKPAPIMQVVQFNFSMHQEVYLIYANDTMGIVTGLLRDSDGCQYRIVWWDDTTRKAEWMFQSELKAIHGN